MATIVLDSSLAFESFGKASISNLLKLEIFEMKTGSFGMVGAANSYMTFGKEE